MLTSTQKVKEVMKIFHLVLYNLTLYIIYIYKNQNLKNIYQIV